MRPGAMPLVLALLLAPAAAAGFGPEAPGADEQGPVTVYPTWPLLTAELKALAADHPDILRLHSAGKSTAGLDLWLMEVADFENPDRVPLEAREVLWIDGGTHANEYSGVMFVMHLLRFLAEGHGTNETATWIVENRHAFIMPLLNPEGSLNGIGRLNGNLVNINRNYPVGWGDLEEAPLVNNPGPYPASEPETRAVIAWWERLQPDYVASIHCCGNLWLYPYGIEGRDPHPDDRPVLERICDEAYYDVREDCGPIWSTIYPASGSSVDTAYELTGAAAFGFEMSGREALLLWGQPFTTKPIEETESESWRGILHAFREVHRYGAHPVPEVEAVESGAVRLRIVNDGFGNLTRGTVTLVDSDGVPRTAILPRLGPNETATLTVSGRFAPGQHEVTLAYAKRPLGGEGLRHLRLDVVETDRLKGILVEPGSMPALDVMPAGETPDVGAASVPAPGAAAGLAALVALALLRRRR